MKLIVGLGNPGPKYETTRHNAGFLMIDLLADHGRMSWSESKFKAEQAKGRLFGEEVVLLKPQTFMNLSGQSVAPVMRFFKIPVEDVIVLYDEIDLPAGKVKAREGGGHNGHNGIRSIIQETGTRDFHRIKLGVGRPGEDGGHPDQEVHSWVLGKMTDAELLRFQETMLEDVLTRMKGIFERG